MPDEEQKQPPTELALTVLTPARHRLRYHVDDAEIAELIESIHTHGVIEPVIVRKADDHWEVVAGERRCMAAQEAGLESVPVRVVECDDQTAVVLGLAENLERANMLPGETIRAIKYLIDEYNMTQKQVAERLGRSESWVTTMLNIDRLDSHVFQLVESEQISIHDAALLAAIPDPEQQRDVAMQAQQFALRGNALRGHIRRVLALPQNSNPSGADERGLVVQKKPLMSCDLCCEAVHPDLVKWVRICSACMERYIHPLKGES